MFTLTLNKIIGSELLVNAEETNNSGNLTLSNEMEEIEVNYSDIDDVTQIDFEYDDSIYYFGLIILKSGDHILTLEDFNDIKSLANQEIKAIKTHVNEISQWFEDKTEEMEEDSEDNNTNANDELLAA